MKTQTLKINKTKLTVLTTILSFGFITSAIGATMASAEGGAVSNTSQGIFKYIDEDSGKAVVINGEQVTANTNAIGSSTDGADASGSLFARIKSTKGVADKAATDIGSSSDTANASGSLFARIKKVASDLSTTDSTVATKASQSELNTLTSTVGTKAAQTDLSALSTKVGNKTDAKTADTVYGNINDIKASISSMDTNKASASALSTLEGKVGTSSDTSSQSTLFGKLKKLDEEEKVTTTFTTETINSKTVGVLEIKTNRK